MQMEASFTRVFSTAESKRLKIPDEFAKVQYSNQQAAASVSLIFTTNMFWDIKIKRIGEDVYMMNGWSQVVKDIPLRENHFLEFIYASDSVVRLHVYSEDGSNILSVPTAVKSESESNYSAEEAKDPPTFNKVVVVRKHFVHHQALGKVCRSLCHQCRSEDSSHIRLPDQDPLHAQEKLMRPITTLSLHFMICL
ncbi:hypothetical protein SSX86_029625 [Deinandra increscens subsp. villosa]|uniref:TF-B3 domain-containing protein n=1 Tax=Deinandra increscens subsp. villosa TaxID=3103831 RepID=A0AAP0GMJ8_9ASTR